MQFERGPEAAVGTGVRAATDRALIRLAVRAPAAGAERVNAAMLELAPAGVERVDGDGFVEFAVYGPPGELPALPRGEAKIAGVRVAVRGDAVPDDWTERWKRFHVPVLIGGRLYVRPPWEQPAVRPGVDEIVIDPAQAFGTGAHPTTRLCLELMLELDARGSFADLGCGSGVLSIAAAKLGFDTVTAYDSDRAAVTATAANARANAVDLATVERFDLRHELPPPAGTVAANLTRPLLQRIASRLGERPRALIASGLLDEEADEVSAAFTATTGHAATLVERRRLSSAGWTALLLTR
jgi:ribosomal protein L11 methyltransferase